MRLVTNAQDTSYFEQQTLPYGTALNETPYSGAVTGTTNQRFTSYSRSVTTGLDYAVNRHYDPQQGRFTQVDPIGMRSVSIESPQTLNLYAYCANDPINHADPTGLGFFSAIGRFFKKVGQLIGKILSNKWVLLVVGIALGVGAGFMFAFAIAEIGGSFFGLFLTGAIVLSAMSAVLIVGAFHPTVIAVSQFIGGIATATQSFLSLIHRPILGTPPWNPSAGIGPVSNLAASAGRKKKKQSLARKIQGLLGDIALLKNYLGSRYNDFVKTINENKDSRVSTELVLCQAANESSFTSLVPSGSGFTSTIVGLQAEVGMLQIKPTTAAGVLGISFPPGQVEELLTDVAFNVRVSTTYLGGLISQHKSVRTALQAYKGFGPSSGMYADAIIGCTKQFK